ncbi:MAG TPA: HlyD family efflux transporter periplasmic adaptor subunit, partial [Aquabacterium sp.]|nr:HlyD family efflux transporter periplasmic adaptor subunit [Aquabacterium sp.]
AKDIEAARSELRSLREREAILGQSLDGVQTLVAPVGGVLASARVLAGQVVASEELLFEVVDPQRVLIEAQVSDPALAAQVQSAVVQGLPQVTLAYQGAARVMREGAVPLTFAARLQNTVLAIGQPLTLVATLSRQQPGVAVPAEAVVRNPSNETVVWIKLSAERFLPQPVQTQPLDASTVLVTRGLSPDNRVVVQGASLINQIR